MYKRFPHSIYVTVIISAIYVCAACRQAPSVLEPQGVAAAKIGQLSWILIGLGALIYVGVSTFLLLALVRRRQAADSRAAVGRTSQSSRNIIIGGGIVMPAVVLLSISGLTLNSLIGLATDGSSNELTIQVNGHQW